jgi:hypothetical protein
VGAWLSSLVRAWSLPKAIATGVAVAAVLILAFFLRPMEKPALAENDVGDLIAQHAQHSETHPLGDLSRMTFVSSEMNTLKTGE